MPSVPQERSLLSFVNVKPLTIFELRRGYISLLSHSQQQERALTVRQCAKFHPVK